MRDFVYPHAPRCGTIFLGCAVLLLSSCSEPNAKQKPTVSVLVEEPVIQTIRVKAKESAKTGITDHNDARTDWMFSIKPELDFAIKEEKKAEDGYHIWITLNGVRLKLSLPIKTYASDKAAKEVLDHERGHVEICKKIYENAREFGSRAANGQIGKTFEGFGADRKLALSNAIQVAAQEVTSPYRADTSQRADEVSSNYDLLCESEDRSGQVDKTVKEAFAATQKKSDGVQRSSGDSQPSDTKKK